MALLWQVLEHLPQPWTAMSEVNRVLKPGGRVVGSASRLKRLVTSAPADGLRRAKERLRLWRHRLRLRWATPSRDARYRGYLEDQLNRTVSKKANEPRARAAALIGALQEHVRLPADAAILCVGCRNDFELRCFRKRGLHNVIGVDLFSEHPDIRVMDMHELRLENDRFDVIYSSHSLEHAYDARKAAAEIVRVAKDGAAVVIEVPIGFKPQGSDRVDFRDLDGLLEPFQAHVGRVLWSQTRPAGADDNPEGNAVLRVIFTVSKRAVRSGGGAMRNEPPDVRPNDLWYTLRRYYVDEFFARRAAELPAGAKVLDLGGKKRAKRGQFDVSRYPLRVQYANIDPATGPDFVCDAAQVPVPAGAYDAVICAELLEHVPHPRAVLAEAARLLRPGGVLLLTAPFHYDLHGDPHDYARYTDTWLRETLPAAGFAAIEIERQGGLFTVLADMLKRFAAEDVWPKSRWGRRLFRQALGWWVRCAFALERSGRYAAVRTVNAYTTGFGVKAVKVADCGTNSEAKT